MTIDPEDAKDLFHQDLPDSVALALEADLRPQSLGIYWSITSYAASNYIQMTHVICEDDTTTPFAAPIYLVSSAQAADRNKIDNVLRHKAGHSPFLSQSEWMARMLIEVARHGADAGLS